MPFTPSHVAAVLPLRRSGVLPFAALAIGSMSPDLPYYLPGLRRLGALTHTAWAIPTLDLALGVAAWLVWRWLAPAARELSPTPIRRRWRLPSTRPRWWGVLAAVTIGAATHVLLDEFTHAGRFGATHIAALAASYPSPLGGRWEGYRWAQYLGGALGLVALAWVAGRSAVHPVESAPPRLARWLPWTAVAAGIVGAAGAIGLAGGGSIGPRAAVFTALTGGIGASVMAVAGLAIVHRLKPKAPLEPSSSTMPPDAWPAHPPAPDDDQVAEGGEVLG
jgi:hypothetical protein